MLDRLTTLGYTCKKGASNESKKIAKELKKLLGNAKKLGYTCNKSETSQLANVSELATYNLSLRQRSHYGGERKAIFGKMEENAANGQWMCWCYSNLTRTRGACSAV